jgi:hypothetical protein
MPISRHLWRFWHPKWHESAAAGQLAQAGGAGGIGNNLFEVLALYCTPEKKSFSHSSAAVHAVHVLTSLPPPE